MREIQLPPSAPALLESLRSIGYSFDSALADIIDNSLAAGATKVDVEFRPDGRMCIAVVDDGCGMSAANLVIAMQHGGVGPAVARESGDLGRFGLGLKTASLSQCRKLSVATLHDGELSGAVWNLSRVEETGAWTLGILESGDLESIPHLDRIHSQGHGTVVLWEQFDRALAGEANPADALGKLIDKARDHLGLVFHRFLKAEAGQRRIALRVNGLAVEGSDPFLSNQSTELPSQPLMVEGHQITFTPFILPHRSRLSHRQLAEIDGEDGLRRTQGFYVYRNRRLITSGTWFRLMRQEELTKLARVRVDIPNALDHLWHLDVKKSTASPPHEVRAGLLQVIEKIGGSSKRVYTHRGWKSKGHVARIWDRLETQRGVNYRINRDHPAVAAVMRSISDDRARDLNKLIAALEMTIPFDAIYADMASEREVEPDFSRDEIEEDLRVMLEAIVGALAGNPEARERLLAQVLMMEPFSGHADVTKRLLKEVRGA